MLIDWNRFKDILEMIILVSSVKLISRLFFQCLQTSKRHLLRNNMIKHPLVRA